MSDLSLSHLKRCSKCRTTKPVEQFSRNRTRQDGRRAWCRECSSATAKAYYHTGNGKEVKRRRDQSPVGRASQQRWGRSQSGKRAKARYDAKMRGAFLAPVTATLESLVVAQDERCYICGVRFSGESPAHYDHFVPVRLGGVHADHNLAAAHGPCNSRKGSRYPDLTSFAFIPHWLSYGTRAR